MTSTIILAASGLFCNHEQEKVIRNGKKNVSGNNFSEMSSEFWEKNRIFLIGMYTQVWVRCNPFFKKKKNSEAFPSYQQ